MMPICTKSEFMLCEVCPQDDKHTTFKMVLVRIYQGYANIAAAPSTFKIMSSKLCINMKWCHRANVKLALHTISAVAELKRGKALGRVQNRPESFT